MSISVGGYEAESTPFQAQLGALKGVVTRQKKERQRRLLNNQPWGHPTYPCRWGQNMNTKKAQYTVPQPDEASVTVSIAWGQGNRDTRI